VTCPPEFECTGVAVGGTEPFTSTSNSHTNKQKHITHQASRSFRLNNEKLAEVQPYTLHLQNNLQHTARTTEERELCSFNGCSSQPALPSPLQKKTAEELHKHVVTKLYYIHFFLAINTRLTDGRLGNCGSIPDRNRRFSKVYVPNSAHKMR
jgi:hypothetical protein